MIRVSTIALLGFLSLSPHAPPLRSVSGDGRSCSSPDAVEKHISANTLSIDAPVRNGILTSGFGWRLDPFTHTERFHSGVDIAAAEGTPIRSVGFGRVAYTGEYGGYGHLIVLDHGGGLTSHYAHCDQIQVHAGNIVTGGEVIGTVGASGRATGPHVHFEFRLNGKPAALRREQLGSRIGFK